MRLRLTLAALAIAAAGCASVSPLQPLPGGTARQAWQELTRVSAVGGTLATYASVRISTADGRRSFRATIQAGAENEVQMRAFTPVGTEVFAFEVRGDEMVFADHSSKKWWRGPFAEVAMQLGIPEELRAADFAQLVFGLPPVNADADVSEIGEGIVTQDGMEYRLTGVGLEGVSKAGSSWRVRYEPASFPPAQVTFDDESGRSIVVRHLDLSHSRGTLDPFVVDESYECCFRPTIQRE